MAGHVASFHKLAFTVLRIHGLCVRVNCIDEVDEGVAGADEVVDVVDFHDVFPFCLELIINGHYSIITNAI